jgi:hypothetical protein
VLRYRDLREDPGTTLDRICDFLGVATGVVTTMSAENVTTHASQSLLNRAVAQVLRAGTTLEQRLPGPAWGPVERLLTRHLQREQRPREALTPDQRDALIGHFAEDVALLQELTGESFTDWVDAHRPTTRAELRPAGRIGTAHNSIDQPIRD